MTRLVLIVGAVVLAGVGCGLGDSVAQRPPGPSRVVVGELVSSTWLPAGLDEFRFSAADQQRLADLGLTQIQWLQRAERDGRSAEAWAMAFCTRQGLSMPVYYEPPGFSPYDKLVNWAAMTARPADFAAAVALRAAALKTRWEAEPAFAGYLVGHEDYDARAYPSLAAVVAVLQRVDGQRPAITVGDIDSYPRRQRFLDAFFPDQGPTNVFQHERYVFTADVAPGASGRVRHRLAALTASYDRVARALRDRNGRWHAIIQVHGEDRDGEPYYRPPTPAEIRVQAGLALARGASGIVTFLYSSGLEEVRDGDGRVVQVRRYDGLVDRGGTPNERWAVVRQLNLRLARLSPHLADRFFRGGYAARRVPADEPVSSPEDDLDLAFFGDRGGTSHVLVVNRRTDALRRVRLEPSPGVGLRDVETGQRLDSGPVTVELGAGDWRLFETQR